MGLDVDAYLERIGYREPPRPSAETLHALHVAHTFSVPFENLDVHLGRTIALEPDALFDKIVRRRRGGYCFELNGLFALLLEALGFTAHRLMARVRGEAAGPSPRSHQVLLVECGGESWLADVGFGGRGLIAPLPLRPVDEAVQYADRFRLARRPSSNRETFLLQSALKGAWRDLYEFSLERFEPVDYIFANYYHSHAPESLFTQHVICTKPTPDGRVTLTDRDLTIRTAQTRRRHTVADPDEFRTVLHLHFGIEADDLAACFSRAAARGGTPLGA